MAEWSSTTWWIIMVAYAAVQLFIGLYSIKFSVVTEEDYFLGRRQIGTILMMFTLMAAQFSAFGIIGIPGIFYRHGIGMWAGFGASNMVFPLFVYLIGRKVYREGRKHNYQTTGEMLAARYDSNSLKYIASILLVFFVIFYLGIQLLGTGKIIEAASGGKLSFFSASVIFGLTVGIYTIFGGYRGVVWTDLFQGIVLLSALLALAGYCVIKSGGLAGLADSVALTSPKLSEIPGPLGFWTLAMIFSQHFLVFFGCWMQPQFWARYNPPKDERTLKLMSLSLPIFMVVIFTCLYAYGIYTKTLFPDLKNPDTVVPLLLTKIPVILGIVLVLGVIGAAMSTADSIVIAISQYITRDLLGGLKRRYSEKRVVYVAHYITLGTIIFAWLIAMYPPGLIFNIAVDFTYAGTAQVVPALIGGWVWRRAKRYGAIAGIFVGMALMIYLRYVMKIPSPLGFHVGLWGFFANVIVFIIVSYLIPGKGSEAK